MKGCLTQKRVRALEAHSQTDQRRSGPGLRCVDCLNPSGVLEKCVQGHRFQTAAQSGAFRTWASRSRYSWRHFFRWRRRKVGSVWTGVCYRPFRQLEFSCTGNSDSAELTVRLLTSGCIQCDLDRGTIVAGDRESRGNNSW